MEKILVTEKFLHISPYLSTTWSEVSSLRQEGPNLFIALKNFTEVKIPFLKEKQLEAIFTFHEKYLDHFFSAKQPLIESPPPFAQDLLSSFQPSREKMLQFAIGTPGDISDMEHNPHLKDLPELDPEVIKKIVSIVKVLTPEGEEAFLSKESVEGCNCPACQIRHFLEKENQSGITQEEEFLEKPTEVMPWIISSVGENLYKVESKENPEEVAHVFLGNPLGCSCGEHGCPHLIAVLKSS